MNDSIPLKFLAYGYKHDMKEIVLIAHPVPLNSSIDFEPILEACRGRIVIKRTRSILPLQVFRPKRDQRYHLHKRVVVKVEGLRNSLINSNF